MRSVACPAQQHHTLSSGCTGRDGDANANKMLSHSGSVIAITVVFRKAATMAAYKASVSPGRTTGRKSALTAVLSRNPPCEAMSLLDLPMDAQLAVLGHLNAQDLAQCARVCQSLHRTAGADVLWRHLCKCTWPDADAAAWLHAPAGESAAQDGPQRAASYRQLYPELSWHSQLLGVWRRAGQVEHATCYSFSWGIGCVEGVRITYDSPDDTYDLRPSVVGFHRIGGSAGGATLHDAEPAVRPSCQGAETMRGAELHLDRLDHF